MRSVLIRTIALLIQFILAATAVHILSMLIGRLLEAHLRRRRRLSIEFLPCRELPPSLETVD